LRKRLSIKKNKPLPKNGTFISLKSNTSANSVLNDNQAQFGSHLSVDGGLETRWAAKDTLPELIVNLNPKDRFNKISIFEYQDVNKSADPKDIFSNYRFNRIQSYKIQILKDDKWVTVFSDDRSMGDCKVIRFPVYYQTSKIKLKVTKASAPPSIYEMNVIDK